MTAEQLKVLDDAIKINGKVQQTEMIIEECAELIHALQRYKRDPSQEREKNVCEEIADVKIMIRQAEQMFPKAWIDLVMESKINRLRVRLKKKQ